jgi:hypothetical protein
MATILIQTVKIKPNPGGDMPTFIVSVNRDGVEITRHDLRLGDDRRSEFTLAEVFEHVVRREFRAGHGEMTVTIS